MITLKFKKVYRDQKGFSLLEALISLLLIGIISVTFLSGLGSVSATTVTTDERESGRSLAQAQLEYIKSQVYATSYNPGPISNDYLGYAAVISVTPVRDSNLQKILVTVTHRGQTVAELEGYKVR